MGGSNGIVDSSASGPQPTRRISGRLFRYLLREYLAILGLCLAAFLTLFVISALYDDLQDFTDHGVSLLVASRYFLYLLPEFLIAILPMSLLLAAMYTIASMNKNNEITAIRASGISIPQAALPILLVALVFTGLQFALIQYLAPKARTEAISFKDRLTRPGASELPNAAYVAYRNKDDRRDWLFGDFSADGESQQVTITQFRPDGTVDWELRAAAASHDLATGWIFRQAMVKQLDDAGEFPVGPVARHERLERPDLTENPESISFAFLLKPAETLTLAELHGILQQRGDQLSDNMRAIIRTQFHYQLSLPFSCLIAVLLGVPLAIVRQRGDTMRSFIVAAGLMVLYYVSSQLFVMLGKKEVLPPMLAGWLPALAYLTWGSWEMKRRR